MPTVNGDFPNLNTTELTEEGGLKIERGEIPANDVIALDSADLGTPAEVAAAPADGSVVYIDTEAAAVTLTVEEVPAGTRVTVINDADTTAQEITLAGGEGVDLSGTVAAAAGNVVELIHVQGGNVVATGDLV